MRNICIIFVCLFTACVNNDSSEKNNTPISVDSSTYTGNEKLSIDSTNHPKFNIQEYKMKFDSSLINIIGKDVKSRLIVDTIRKKAIFSELEGTELSTIVNSAETVVKYSFNLLGKNSRQRHHVIIISFKEKSKLDSVFFAFKSLALEKSGVPGLTYSSDYIVQLGNSIYWLNSNCSYSYQSHQTFVGLFNKIVHIEDEMAINCECGKVRCVFSRASRASN